jgi:hypothetical protein
MYLSLLSISALLCVVNGFQMNPNRIIKSQLYSISENEIIDVSAEVRELKAQWFPIGDMKAPETLDGTLAGDVGFDPLMISKSTRSLYWMREAEVKHSRLAMLAAIGWPISELWHKEIASILNMESILAPNDKAPSILNGGLSNTYASGTLMASIVIAAYLESKAMKEENVFWNSDKPEDYVPGDLGFDPLNLYEKRGDKKSMETAELKHGRLAMIVVTVYVLQEFLTGRPVV